MWPTPSMPPPLPHSVIVRMTRHGLPAAEYSFGDIPRHDAAGSYDGSRADADASKDDRSAADPHIRSNLDRLSKLFATPLRGVEWMQRATPFPNKSRRMRRRSASSASRVALSFSHRSRARARAVTSSGSSGSYISPRQHLPAFSRHHREAITSNVRNVRDVPGSYEERSDATDGCLPRNSPS